MVTGPVAIDAIKMPSTKVNKAKNAHHDHLSSVQRVDKTMIVSSEMERGTAVLNLPVMVFMPADYNNAPPLSAMTISSLNHGWFTTEALSEQPQSRCDRPPRAQCKHSLALGTR